MGRNNEDRASKDSQRTKDSGEVVADQPLRCKRCGGYVVKHYYGFSHTGFGIDTIEFDPHAPEVDVGTGTVSAQDDSTDLSKLPRGEPVTD
jgi:hypothetical protein